MILTKLLPANTLKLFFFAVSIAKLLFFKMPIPLLLSFLHFLLHFVNMFLFMVDYTNILYNVYFIHLIILDKKISINILPDKE